MLFMCGLRKNFPDYENFPCSDATTLQVVLGLWRCAASGATLGWRTTSSGRWRPRETNNTMAWWRPRETNNTMAYASNTPSKHPLTTPHHQTHFIFHTIYSLKCLSLSKSSLIYLKVTKSCKTNWAKVGTVILTKDAGINSLHLGIMLLNNVSPTISPSSVCQF